MFLAGDLSFPELVGTAYTRSVVDAGALSKLDVVIMSQQKPARTIFGKILRYF